MKSMMNKIHSFLNGIDFFVTLLHIAWSVGIVGLSVIVDWNHLVFPILRRKAVLFALLVLCAVTGVFLQKYLSADPKKKAAVISHNLFYFGIPILMGLFRPLVLDLWYDFSGSFMPGMEALGLAVFGWIWGGIALLGCLVFWGIWFIDNKRAEKGKSWNLDFWKKFKNIMNAVAFWVLLTAIIVAGICYCIVFLKETMNERGEERNEAYLEKRISELTASSGKSDPGEVTRELLHDGFTCSYFVQVASGDDQISNPEICEGVNQLMTYGKLSEETFCAGLKDYRDFTKSHLPQRNVDMINQEILADAKAKTVSVSVELYVYDIVRESMYEACMITTFDEEWNVISMRCASER